MRDCLRTLKHKVILQEKWSTGGVRMKDIRGTKVMVNTCSTEHRRRQEDMKEKCEATKEKYEATSAW